MHNALYCKLTFMDFIANTLTLYIEVFVKVEAERSKQSVVCYCV